MVTHYVFPGFLTPILTQLFFPKPPTTFLTCFCRGERRKYAGKKSRLNRGSNSQPPGHESDTLTTEPPGRGFKRLVQPTCKNQGLFRKRLMLCHNIYLYCLKTSRSYVMVWFLLFVPPSVSRFLVYVLKSTFLVRFSWNLQFVHLISSFNSIWFWKKKSDNR